MNTIAIYQFKQDFIIKTLVQEVQFAQWLRSTFYLNQKLFEEFDLIYQEAFYVKLYTLLEEGLKYATKVREILSKGENISKTQWYTTLIESLLKIRSSLDESELLYIEYRRHSASHIFQNDYEHIQDDLSIKKIRKKRDLAVIKNSTEDLIRKHGSDRKIDEYLNKKLHPELTRLYDNLK